MRNSWAQFERTDLPNSRRQGTKVRESRGMEESEACADYMPRGSRFELACLRRFVPYRENGRRRLGPAPGWITPPSTLRGKLQSRLGDSLPFRAGEFDGR